ncbi:MAG TPA: NAD(P)H-dependent oxidoreductase subunit E [Nitrospirota bacterium]|nr:NAD(P)H-dependent oxidoreductase subunit E [Nitrospirota bacterium]
MILVRTTLPPPGHLGRRENKGGYFCLNKRKRTMERKLEGILTRYRENEGNLISILQDLESEFGYLREDAIMWLSEQLDVPPARFYGVATFYAQFHLKPRGKNIITACCGTACHVKGSERLINSLVKELAIPEGEETSEDLKFTVEKVNCVGACSIAPVIIINKTVHGKMTPDKLVKEMKTLKEGKREYIDYI